MILQAWRITQARHASIAFTGVGAKIAGGRWNTPGTAVVYAAGSQSLAILELLVHLHQHEVLQHYVTFEMSFDAALVTTPARLPTNWRRSPAPASVQQVGDDWVASATSAILQLPSAIVPSESNFLINPAHPDFAKINIGPRQKVKLDPRLIKSPET